MKTCRSAGLDYSKCWDMLSRHGNGAPLDLRGAAPKLHVVRYLQRAYSWQCILCVITNLVACGNVRGIMGRTGSSIPSFRLRGSTTANAEVKRVGDELAVVGHVHGSVPEYTPEPGLRFQADHAADGCCLGPSAGSDTRPAISKALHMHASLRSCWVTDDP
ncbi:hypothetical protein BAUCODRAFT_140829 [Baudoinia panamericana UAMH 10762]|uniref:Uncharacterized protein n=1 Tax=Baudoinia panamericana (strain UAMH 10762) TaxID=717646 RepID=M2LJX7_BAUPA|nr:uncharacterized protein BAUCODRAFT_140829 [Baudoinia panamericana UAMH 10762]EMC94512.1 hypothetical protein BAUCODRAFT_140829 [Baudoinia panamericana UAMH 10762]